MTGRCVRTTGMVGRRVWCAVLSAAVRGSLTRVQVYVPPLYRLALDMTTLTYLTTSPGCQCSALNNLNMSFKHSGTSPVPRTSSEQMLFIVIYFYEPRKRFQSVVQLLYIVVNKTGSNLYSPSFTGRNKLCTLQQVDKLNNC